MPTRRIMILMVGVYLGMNLVTGLVRPMLARRAGNGGLQGKVAGAALLAS